MRKRKTKLGNLIMLLLILLVLFYIVFQQKSIKITADELVVNYSLNQKNADEKFLNKDLELTGKVKSYYEFKNDKNILELKSESDSIGLYCRIMNKETDEKAHSLTTGKLITIYGKCLGINPPKLEKFTNGIYVEADRIK